MLHNTYTIGLYNVRMEFYDALEQTARNAGVSFNAIGTALGHSMNYVHNARSRGSVPSVDNASRMADVCGYALALIPRGDLPESAITIDPS